LAVAVYLGGTVFLGAVLIPVLRRRGLDAEGLQLLAGVLRIFHPVSLASLGLLVLTGAVALTPLKESLGPEYVPRLFGVLALKLLLVFILIMVSSYQFFALGPRFLRALPTEEETRGGVPSPPRDSVGPALAKMEPRGCGLRAFHRLFGSLDGSHRVT